MPRSKSVSSMRPAYSLVTEDLRNSVFLHTYPLCHPPCFSYNPIHPFSVLCRAG